MREKTYLAIAAAILFLMLTGCSTVQTDTRLFAVGYLSSNTGFDPGIDYSAEQRIKVGPIMALAGGEYSPTSKDGATGGYQWGADIGGRFYMGPWFLGAGYYWSGYKVDFNDGREWSKEAHNVTFSAGWEYGPYEIRLTGSPEESQSPNHVSYIGADAEWKFYGPWIITIGMTRMEYDQGGSRESGWIESAGIGLEF